MINHLRYPHRYNKNLSESLSVFITGNGHIKRLYLEENILKMAVCVVMPFILQQLLKISIVKMVFLFF